MPETKYTRHHVSIRYVIAGVFLRVQSTVTKILKNGSKSCAEEAVMGTQTAIDYIYLHPEVGAMVQDPEATFLDVALPVADARRGATIHYYDFATKEELLGLSL